MRTRPSAAWLGSLSCLIAALAGGCELVGHCTSSVCVEDRQITREVQARFSGAPELQAPNQVQVQSRRHVVYLTGLVDTPFEQQMAQSLAAQVPGVTRVDNAIALSGNAH